MSAGAAGASPLPANPASGCSVTPFPWSDVLIIAGLILLNGLFAMSELAIVSARPARLKVAAERGSPGARTALALAADPGKLLSTAQIGITLIGIIAGAFSGASLGGPLAERLIALGLPVTGRPKLASPSPLPAPPISAWLSANWCPSILPCAPPSRSHG